VFDWYDQTPFQDWSPEFIWNSRISNGHVRKVEGEFPGENSSMLYGGSSKSTFVPSKYAVEVPNFGGKVAHTERMSGDPDLSESVSDSVSGVSAPVVAQGPPVRSSVGLAGEMRRKQDKETNSEHSKAEHHHASAEAEHATDSEQWNDNVNDNVNDINPSIMSMKFPSITNPSITNPRNTTHPLYLQKAEQLFGHALKDLELEVSVDLEQFYGGHEVFSLGTSLFDILLSEWKRLDAKETQKGKRGLHANGNTGNTANSGNGDANDLNDRGLHNGFNRTGVWEYSHFPNPGGEARYIHPDYLVNLDALQRASLVEEWEWPGSGLIT
jgi:hypothetical protein